MAQGFAFVLAGKAGKHTKQKGIISKMHTALYYSNRLKRNTVLPTKQKHTLERVCYKEKITHLHFS
ncbi:MAG: hypothetical protein EAZ95_01305 [Bacteroidetes bacterium]|nr:MAG: hypothetical protein EAZ95_01305 [Bacteroidota bacterium]